MKQVKPGDKVAYFAPGSYAEYKVLKEGELNIFPAFHLMHCLVGQALSVPEKLSTKDASAILLQGMTALAFTSISYPVKAGDVALVHAAAGGTGSVLVQLIKARGGVVIGTTSTAEKAEVAKAHGCDHVIIYTEKDTKEEVMRLTSGLGAHVVYDGVGKSTFDTSLSCLRRHGTLISFGNASGKGPPVDILRLSTGSVRLMRPTLMDYVTTPDELRSRKTPAGCVT